MLSEIRCTVSATSWMVCYTNVSMRNTVRVPYLQWAFVAIVWSFWVVEHIYRLQACPFVPLALFPQVFVKFKTQTIQFNMIPRRQIYEPYTYCTNMFPQFVQRWCCTTVPEKRACDLSSSLQCTMLLSWVNNLWRQVAHRLTECVSRGDVHRMCVNIRHLPRSAAPGSGYCCSQTPWSFPVLARSADPDVKHAAPAQVCVLRSWKLYGVLCAACCV